MKIRHHIFVCVNERPEQAPKGCCSRKGGVELVQAFKEAGKSLGAEQIKVTRSYCLGPCEQGANVVVYPEGVWYHQVQPSDVEEIIRDHVLAGKPVSRLRSKEFGLG